MKYSTHEKILSTPIILSLFLTRMTMAIEHVFAGLSILYGLFMIFRYRSTLTVPGDWKKYSMAYLIFVLFLLPSLYTSHHLELSVKN